MQHHPTRVCAIPERPLTALATLPPLQHPHHPPGAMNGLPTTSGSGGSGCVLILSASAAQLDLWRLPPAHCRRGVSSTAPGVPPCAPAIPLSASPISVPRLQHARLGAVRAPVQIVSCSCISGSHSLFACAAGCWTLDAGTPASTVQALSADCVVAYEGVRRCRPVGCLS